MTVTLCSVCQKDPSKYRCPSCNTATCSLACTKLHKLECSVVAVDKDVSTIANDQPEIETKKAHETSQQSRNPDLFATLPSSEDLQQMFKKHPKLRMELQEIARRANDPSAMQTSHHSQARRYTRGRDAGRFSRQGTTRQDHWTPEKGFGNALNVLNQALSAESMEQEGLREYAQLILRQYPLDPVPGSPTPV